MDHRITTRSSRALLITAVTLCSLGVIGVALAVVMGIASSR